MKSLSLLQVDLKKKMCLIGVELKLIHNNWPKGSILILFIWSEANQGQVNSHFLRLLASVKPKNHSSHTIANVKPHLLEIYLRLFWAALNFKRFIIFAQVSDEWLSSHLRPDFENVAENLLIIIKPLIQSLHSFDTVREIDIGACLSKLKLDCMSARPNQGMALWEDVSWVLWDFGHRPTLKLGKFDRRCFNQLYFFWAVKSMRSRP